MRASADSMVSAARSLGPTSVSTMAVIAVAATAPRTRAADDDCDRFRAPETTTPRVTTNPTLRSENLNVGVSALQGSGFPYAP